MCILWNIFCTSKTKLEESESISNVGSDSEPSQESQSKISATYCNDTEYNSELSEMFCWGSTIHGELGLGGIEDEQIQTPRPLDWTEATKICQAGCGETHSLLLSKDGKVYSCGNNDFGQLGHDQPRKRPQLVQGLDASHIVQVACGSVHSLALNEWGQVFSWGADSSGQLGHQLGTKLQSTAKIIKPLATEHVIQIAAGQRHSLALTNNGELYAWGANNYGQLGLGTTTSYESAPTLISSLYGIPIAFIACGGNHSFVISRSGAVFGWGKNTCGQLGINTDESKAYPCQLRTLRNIKVTYIACGDEYSVFLTMDGGVFTCGSGMYGQLGHGSFSNEILPRKVLELMGSTITQVSCGRRHTLALVPSRGRVYSFGLGGAGQLGGRKPANTATPQVVLGPWVSPSGTAVIETASPANKNCVLNRIFSGGDHCFVTVTDRSKNLSPHDCRVYEPSTQIVQLTVDKLKMCLKISPKVAVDQDTLSYLETVFKSLACINASFLLKNNEHYCCTSSHHGVDVEHARSGFSNIGKFENQSLKDLIWNSITEHLVGKLTSSPPDVEALRIYLTLPLYHEFSNPKQHPFLHRPFAKAMLGLTPPAKRVVGVWWSSMSNDYFERLVHLFKNVVAYIIRLQRVPENRTITYDASLSATLEILACLNKLNYSVEGLKVPYDTFHLPELNDCLDVRIDYVLWLNDPNVNKLYLCNYPFLFDAQAKTKLLQMDQSLQMESAMTQAASQAFTSFMFGRGVNPEVQFLVLNVSRENIVADTLRELLDARSSDLKKPLKIRFAGEEAEDAGGPRKEFFLLLLREVLDAKYGMFKEYEETRAMWFSEDSFEDEVMYLLIGLICGLAIYNFTIIDLPFPLVLYKKLLKEPVGLPDVKGLSPTLANSLQSLLDYDGHDVESVFCLMFEVTRNTYGQVKVIPLKPGGEKIPVNQENKKEYVDLYVDFILNTSVDKHYQAFSTGFMKVCGGRVLELFHSHELMAVVVGNENYDWHALEEAASYKNGYQSSSQQVRWFWEVLHALPLDQKKKFLLFLTGSDRIPIQGMKAIKICFQPTADDKCLPVAHTCFNLLDLPRYKTKERLKYKLLQAIQQTEGFSLV